MNRWRERGRGIQEEGTERQEDKRAREQEIDIIFLIHPKRGREKEEKKRQTQVYRAKIWALQ